MLQQAQHEFWLREVASHAYRLAGHSLHPEELSKAWTAPHEYITEHSGMDPGQFEGQPVKETAKKLALGIKEQGAMTAHFEDHPIMRAHMEAVNAHLTGHDE